MKTSSNTIARSSADEGSRRALRKGLMLTAMCLLIGLALYTPPASAATETDGYNQTAPDGKVAADKTRNASLIQVPREASRALRRAASDLHNAMADFQALLAPASGDLVALGK